MNSFNILLIYSLKTQLTAEQIKYLVESLAIMNTIKLTHITIVTQTFIAALLPFEIKQIIVDQFDADQLEEILKSHQIQLLLTPYENHLTQHANSKRIIGLIHHTKTMYPIKICIEVAAFNQLDRDVLTDLATLQNHPNYLLEITLVKTYGQSIHKQTMKNFSYANGTIQQELFLVESTVKEVIRFENPTLYLSCQIPKQEQWFLEKPVIKLYV